MEMRRDVFQAIADPTRRDILTMLAGQQMNLNSIAENFDSTRQAISLHIKILHECGLISIRQQGRERFCEAKLEKLSEVNQWTEQFRVFWTNKLSALKNYVEAEHQAELKAGSTTTKTKNRRSSQPIKKSKKK